MTDGCPVIVAQWQTTGCISHGVLGSIPGDWWPFYFPLYFISNLCTNNVQKNDTTLREHMHTLYTQCHKLCVNRLAKIIHSFPLSGKFLQSRIYKIGKSLNTELVILVCSVF